MPFQPIRPVLLAGAFLCAALVVLGWLDYRAVSQELQTVVRGQAAALHATVAAAARAQHAAAEHAEAALTERLLESARLLRELDRAGALTAAGLNDLAARNSHVRVVVFARDGAREFAAGEPPGRARGESSPLSHGGRGQGAGAGGLRIAERLLTGEIDEIVTPPHTSQAGAERVAAGVRRSNGGAIVVNAASDVAQQLDDVYSLGALLAQIAQATPALAYIVVDDAGRRVSDGPLAGAVIDENGPAPAERDRVVAGVRVLERRNPVELGDDRSADLRIGMRLDDVVRGERRTLVRVGAGLSGALALTVVALAFVSLRQRFGALAIEHARAREALSRRDRLAAMGELASTVAHEIRNPLNAIAMSAQRLGREYPRPPGPADAEELDDLLGVIQHESARINQTVQQFLDYARPRPLNRQVVSIAPWLDDVSRSASSVAAARGVHIATHAPSALNASIDPAQLREAIDNLVRNAIDASPQGGTVTLDARADGKGIAIVVADEGAGIPADTLPRIFDLYFTTKPEGTGIGLAVAQQVVTAHGGTIEVDSDASRGTRMRVRIPADETMRG
jgi:signal transduction histidine kinase